MKCLRIYCLFMFVASMFATLQVNAQSNTLSDSDVVNKTSSKLLDAVIHADSLKSIVKFLAADSMKGRYTGTMANIKAAEFIAGEFRKTGLKPVAGNNGFFMSFSATPPGKILKSYNVVGVLPGKTKPQEVVIFCAHFDHVGTIAESMAYLYRGEPEKGDEIFNGANDNASGVAAVIALARYYSKLKNNERTLMFIAFSGEELGMQGSTAMVNNLNPPNVMAVVNIEMIGRASVGMPANPFVTGAGLSDFRKVLNDELELQGEKNFKKNYFRNDQHAPGYFDRSDNYPFAQAGIPAHAIMLTTDEDPYYHTVHDEHQTLNYPLMTKVVKAIALGCRGLVEGRVTLKRIEVPKQKEDKRERDTVPKQRVIRDN